MEKKGRHGQCLVWVCLLLSLLFFFSLFFLFLNTYRFGCAECLHPTAWKKCLMGQRSGAVGSLSLHYRKNHVHYRSSVEIVPVTLRRNITDLYDHIRVICTIVRSSTWNSNFHSLYLSFSQLRQIYPLLSRRPPWQPTNDVMQYLTPAIVSPLIYM